MKSVISETGLDPDNARIEHEMSTPINMLTIEPVSLSSPVEWGLPPSKSHLIRWLALISQTKQEVFLTFNGTPGNDVISMSKCIEGMGSSIEEQDSGWLVSGSPGLNPDSLFLNCGNSGTTANFLTAISACNIGTVSLDGDRTLRSRSSKELCSTLRQMGCTIDSDSVPRVVSGGIENYDVLHDWSRTSQGLSSLMIASPRFEEELRISLSGESVSSGYWMLTQEICISCGSKMTVEGDEAILPPWEIDIPEGIEIPPEESLRPVAILLSHLHGVDFETGLEDSGIGISRAIKSVEEREKEVFLGEASDIITPIAAIMAMGDGGRISGAAHARGKESDRISKTVELLGSFKLSSKETDDGLLIQGGQCPVRPKEPVETHGDHRLAMTAMALASKTGGTILEPECSAVTDPTFIDKIISLG